MRRRDFLGGGGYSVARVFFIPFPFVFPSVVPVARYSVVPAARWRGIPVARRLVASSPRRLVASVGPRSVASVAWYSDSASRLGNTRLASVPRLPRVVSFRLGEMSSRRALSPSRTRHPHEAAQGNKAHEAQRTISMPRLASSPRICDTVPHIGDLPSPHPRGIIPTSIGRSPRGKRPPHQDARQLRRR